MNPQLSLHHDDVSFCAIVIAQFAINKKCVHVELAITNKLSIHIHISSMLAAIVRMCSVVFIGLLSSESYSKKILHK
jgi:hypothetical protein